MVHIQIEDMVYTEPSTLSPFACSKMLTWRYVLQASRLRDTD